MVRRNSTTLFYRPTTHRNALPALPRHRLSQRICLEESKRKICAVRRQVPHYMVALLAPSPTPSRSRRRKQSTELYGPDRSPVATEV